MGVAPGVAGWLSATVPPWGRRCHRRPGPEVVHFYQPHPCGGVRPGATPCIDPATGSLLSQPQEVLKRQSCRSNDCSLARVILPVVVRGQERSIGVVQLKGRIGQHTRLFPQAARLGPIPRTMMLYHRCRSKDEARDHDVSARAHKRARADIGQFRVRCWIQIVNFHQGHSRRVVLALKQSPYNFPEPGRQLSLPQDRWSARVL